MALLKDKPYVYNISDMYPDMAVGGSIVQAGADGARVGEAASLGACGERRA